MLVTMEDPHSISSIPDRIVLTLQDHRGVSIPTRHDGNAAQKRGGRRPPQTCRYCGGEHLIQECEELIAEEMINKEESAPQPSNQQVQRQKQHLQTSKSLQEKYQEEDRQD